MSVMQAVEAPRNDEGLIRAFQLQGRVVGALVLREARTRFGRHYLGYLWAVLEPIIHIVTWLGLLLLIRAPKMNGIPTLAFLTVGMFPLFHFNHVDKFLRGSISANKALLQYPIVKPVDLMISRFVLESGTITFVFTLIIGSLIAIHKIPLPWDPFPLLPAFFGLLLASFGFGTFNAMMLQMWPTWEKFLNPFARIIFITSGLFYDLNRLPIGLRFWFGLNPVAHVIAIIRMSFFPGYQCIVGSIVYVFEFGCIFLLVGVSMACFFRKAIQDDLD